MEQKVDIFSTQEIVVPGSANQQLVKVIEKASKILQFHDETAFVDDALLMLGKSFYYQRNYQKAQRKFLELLANDPESDLRIEAELWSAKSEMRLRNFDTGLQALNTVRAKAIEEGEDEVAEETFIEEIKYYISIEDYPRAITAATELLQNSDNNELNAKVAHQLGKFYLEVNNLAEAISSFESVFSYTPDYETELNNYIELGKAYRLAGNNEKALDIFDDLRSEEKYSEAFDIVDVELGLTYKALGELENAMDNLQYADTAYANSLYSGIAKYEIGLILEKEYNNYDSAFYYYSRAAKSPAPSEYVINANNKFQLFTKYRNSLVSLEQYRKQLNYLNNPEAFIADSIDWFIQDSIRQAEVNRQLNSEGGEETPVQRQSFGNRTTGGQQQQQQAKQTLPPQRPVIGEDSLNSMIVKNEFELGNMFFTEFDRPDSAYYYYIDVLTNYPNSEYHARTLYGIASYYEVEGNKQKADSIYNFIYDNYKTESIVNAAANKIKKPLVNLSYDPAEELYLSAEQNMIDNNLNQSVNQFYTIYQKYPKSPYAPKALFASGYLLENELSLFDSAAAVYDTIAAKYPSTVYAQKIQKKLTGFKQEQERRRKAVLDSVRAVEKRRLDSLNFLEQTRIADSLKADSLNNTGRLPDPNITAPDAEDSINVDGFLPDSSYQENKIDSIHRQNLDSLRRLDSPRGGEDPDFEQLDHMLDSLNPGKIVPPDGPPKR